MIILEKCDIIVSRMRPMQTGVRQVEGKALVYGAYESGLQTVKPSTGSGGEVFAGVMYGEPQGARGATSQAFQDVFTINTTDYTITLPQPAITGQIRVIAPDGTQLTEGAAAANTYQVSNSGRTLTFANTRGGQVVTVRMNYVPTTVEALARYGDAWPGGSASNQQGLTGVCEQGVMMTDQFDVSADWSNPTTIRVGADGLFTTTGSGVIVPAGRALKLPGAGDPWLAISFHL